MKKFLSVLLIALLAFTVVGCGPKEDENDPGKLVIYSPNSETDIAVMIEPFEKATGIDVQVMSMGSGEVMTRIDSEKDNPQADVNWGAINLSWYNQYPDLWEKYVSPNNELMPEAYRNTTGYFTSYGLSGSAALLLNNDVFAELGLDPKEFKGYKDLLRPELKGHIAMGDPSASSSAWAELTNMLLVMGEEAYDDKAWEWVKSFMGQLDGKILDSSSAIYKGVAAGEYAVGVSYEDPCVKLLQDGATNLTLVYPEEGAVWLPSGAAIVKGAPNLENAKKFIDWLISDENQQAMAATSSRQANTKFPSTLEIMTSFDDINVAYEDIPYCAEMKPTWVQKWKDLFAEVTGN